MPLFGHKRKSASQLGSLSGSPLELSRCSDVKLSSLSHIIFLGTLIQLLESPLQTSRKEEKDRTGKVIQDKKCKLQIKQ